MSGHDQERFEAARNRLTQRGADDECLRLARDVVDRLGAFDAGLCISVIQCAILDGMAWASPMPNAVQPAGADGGEAVAKALEWGEPERGFTMRHALTTIGLYSTWTHFEAEGVWLWSLRPRTQFAIVAEGAGRSEAVVQAAAQTDFEGRVRACLALKLDPAPVEDGMPCEMCQGNGEIVTEWGRYLNAKPGDVGDEAVAECPL